jgi:hypothetical protein
MNLPEATSDYLTQLANERGAGPLGAIIEAPETITCQCFGEPDDESREILAGFGTVYNETAAHSFVLNPRADRVSLV